MNWFVAIILALICFAGFVMAFRMPRKVWPVILMALALGLAGYALQASPGLEGAPRQAAKESGDEGWRLVDLRKELTGSKDTVSSNLVVTADALVRHGQFSNAANLLSGAVEKNPNDGEAWLALANALAFQADGELTPAALFAYRRAAQLAPDSAGPSFFVGLSLIRQGRLIDGRELWAQKLGSMPEGTPGREILAQRLGDLDLLLRKIAESAGDAAP